MINTLFTMGFFRTLQQKAHEHKSSTITAAKEAEENASYAESYAALISEKQKAPPKTLGGGNRTYNYNPGDQCFGSCCRNY